MNEPQDNSAVQPVTDQDNQKDEPSEQQQQTEYNKYPIRIHDPDIECVVGLGYD
uniref:Uncharacterized protein n=1 Tax=uncultured Thiotrichaceae bacterium TaxID=298394 RepID=A0A6S6SYB9_9GAMM|nr:MAG: Unknown protein [uncultured Thiotrichaceae bacterium]